MFSRLVLLAVLTASLVFVGVSAAATGLSVEGGSAVMPHVSMKPGSTTVTISIQADCHPYAGASDPQDWSWSVAAGGATLTTPMPLKRDGGESRPAPGLRAGASS